MPFGQPGMIPMGQPGPPNGRPGPGFVPGGRGAPQPMPGAMPPMYGPPNMGPSAPGYPPYGNPQLAVAQAQAQAAANNQGRGRGMPPMSVVPGAMPMPMGGPGRPMPQGRAMPQQQGGRMPQPSAGPRPGPVPQVNGSIDQAAFAAANEGQQKQMLGEVLYPKIQKINPDLAGKITGMLLEMDNLELVGM